MTLNFHIASTVSDINKKRINKTSPKGIVLKAVQEVETGTRVFGSETLHVIFKPKSNTLVN